ncbi:MAG: amino acid-binding protein [Nitrospinae bacterium]|nr:amino acid-binding protein [Nitrospinota bacterium]
MQNWYMLTLVGRDRPGIVAEVSRVLFDAGGNLGEASMARLGGNFTVMIMLQISSEKEEVENLLNPLADQLKLFVHVDKIIGDLHHHVDPNFRLSVHGADQAGIVAAVTGSLALLGFNILNLESDVGGTPEKPIYIMHIEGFADCSLSSLEKSLQPLISEKGIVVHLFPIDTMVG